MTKGSGSQNLKYVAVSLSLLIASNSALMPAWAAASKSDKPSGTLLLPLTPKIDQNDIQPKPATTPSTTNSSSSSTAEETIDSTSLEQPLQSAPATEAALTPEVPQADSAISGAPDKIAPEQTDASSMLEASATADDLQLSEMDSAVSEDTTLKGTIQIVADDTEYDQEKNTFLGTGNAVAIIGGQNSKLEADMILYDQNSQTIDARGHVKILRTGQVTTGSAFKFKVNSDEYLITSPDTELNGTQVIARGAYGTNRGMIFKNGTLDNPTPFHLGKNMLYGPQSSVTDIADKIMHPDAYLTDKPSFVFKARKMIYEKYKDKGFVILGAGDIGGMTLTPGVYKWSTGLLIPTDVTLSGASTDVWIFQVGEELTLDSATTVVLTGGAVASHVFWQVDGLVNVGTTAHLEGVVLTQKSITLKTGASLRGRLLAQTAVNLDANTVTEPTP